jgi:acetyltransferase-like isoleucine patch superfamily enzyme
VNQFSENCEISRFADIEESVRGSSLTVGSRTLIDSFVKIKFAGGNGDISIGDNCQINSGTVIYSGNGIRIGNNVSIAANVVLAPVNHNFSDVRDLIGNQGFMSSKGGIVIEDNVWIGAGAVLLDGSRIGTGSIVGANSLVRGVVHEMTVVAGNPLKILKTRA